VKTGTLLHWTARTARVKTWYEVSKKQEVELCLGVTPRRRDTAVVRKQLTARNSGSENGQAKMRLLQLRGVLGKDIVAMCETEYWEKDRLLEDTIYDFIIALRGDESDSSDSNEENEEEEENSSDDSDLALPLSDSE
jgi:hypothetical protein